MSAHKLNQLGTWWWISHLCSHWVKVARRFQKILQLQSLHRWGEKCSTCQLVGVATSSGIEQHPIVSVFYPRAQRCLSSCVPLMPPCFEVAGSWWHLQLHLTTFPFYPRLSLTIPKIYFPLYPHERKMSWYPQDWCVGPRRYWRPFRCDTWAGSGGVVKQGTTLKMRLPRKKKGYSDYKIEFDRYIYIYYYYYYHYYCYFFLLLLLLFLLFWILLLLLLFC